MHVLLIHALLEVANTTRLFVQNRTTAPSGRVLQLLDVCPQPRVVTITIRARKTLVTVRSLVVAFSPLLFALRLGILVLTTLACDIRGVVLP